MDAFWIGAGVAALAFVWMGAALAQAGARLWRAGLVTVFEYEAGLRFDRGRLTATLGPGRYATWPRPVSIERIDLREQTLDMASQEILTTDALPVRVSLTVRWRVADAARHKAVAQNPYGQLYAAAQAAVRQRVGAATLDALLADRALVDRGLAEELQPQFEALGAVALAASLRDLSLAGAAKQAFADLWKAQKEGQAALERARGEQAALRALANAARMLKGNPELMNLRLVQTLAAKPGQPAPTIVFGTGMGLTPIPAQASNDAAAGASAADPP